MECRNSQEKRKIFPSSPRIPEFFFSPLETFRSFSSSPSSVDFFGIFFLWIPGAIPAGPEPLECREREIGNIPRIWNCCFRINIPTDLLSLERAVLRIPGNILRIPKISCGILGCSCGIPGSGNSWALKCFSRCFLFSHFSPRAAVGGPGAATTKSSGFASPSPKFPACDLQGKKQIVGRGRTRREGIASLWSIPRILG